MTATTIRALLGGRPLLSVLPDATLREAATMMAKHKVGALAVVQQGKLAGILTERDIVFRCIGRSLSVDQMTAGDAMSPDPVTVGIDEAISEALAKRIGGPFRHLPVMHGDQVVGVLSYRDIPPQDLMLFERFREMKTARADGVG